VTIWDWHFAADALPMLIKAFGSSLAAAVEAFLGALLLGSVVAWLLGLGGKVARPTAAVSDFVRKTPILVQLYFVYFVLPDVGIVLSAWVTGVLTLSLHYAFYLAEVYRAGILAIPKGQLDAAKALGLKRYVIFRKVILPQALPIIIPNAGNYFIYMLKDTPYLSAISVVEVMRVSNRLGGDYFRYVEPFTIAGVLFLVASWIAAFLIGALERHTRGRWANRTA
jgi:polar amino acid transport system permease protein